MLYYRKMSTYLEDMPERLVWHSVGAQEEPPGIDES